jgi:hypothetical protein
MSAGPALPDNYVAFVFDDINADIGDLMRAKEAARKYLAEGAQAAEHRGICSERMSAHEHWSEQGENSRNGIGRYKPCFIQALGAEREDLSASKYRT